MRLFLRKNIYFIRLRIFVLSLVFLSSTADFIANAQAQDLSINTDGTTATQVTKNEFGIDQSNIAAPNSSGF